MATKEQVRNSLIALGDESMARGDPGTAGIYFRSAIRLGLEMIEEKRREIENYLSHQRKAS